MNTILRTTLLSVITLGLGAILAYEMFLISKTTGETSEAVVLIDKYTGNDGFVRSVLTFQEEEKDNLEVLDKVSLTKEEIVFLIEGLEDTGKFLDLNVNISSVTADTNAGAPEAVRIVRVTVDARGNWAQSLQFMELLENLPHKVVVESVDLTHDQGSWRNNVVLKVSTFPEKQ
ncbi:MAG: hypothetical protein ACYCY6_01350 [Minisyncoccota bacterium]